MNHIVLDLETDSFDVNKAQVKVFGIYNIDTKEYTITTNSQKALDMISDADFIIGYNIKEYDLPILENRYGFKVPFDKIIDLYQIFKKRQSVITQKPFSNFKLKTIAKELKLDDVGKLDIDYNIFKKESWTEEEKQEISKYLKQDLNLTALLWEYLKKRFEPFKEYLTPKDIANYKHINTSMGSYSYKAVCNMCNLREDYEFNAQHADYEGAFVQIPKKEFARGKILCFDFASLYPMCFIHANLFSHDCECCHPSERWTGGGNFKIAGNYCQKKQGKIEELIKKLYLLRKEYKANKDEREQVIKIIINSLYGVSGSPSFISLYNLNTAQDCTALARQCIKFAINIFEKNGFISLYSDTDSCYVEVPDGKTEEECIELSKQISKRLSEMFPFPWKEFNFKLESKIKYIQFFKEEGGVFKKKHYIYVTDDGKITIKGLQIIKKDTSSLSRLIFDKYIKENIRDKLVCKYEEREVLDWIYKEMSMNRSLAAKQFSVKSQENYKNQTSIQSMIFQKYGEGEHKLIKNKKIGVGKAVKYCTIEEAREIRIQDFDIDIFLRELSPFINQTPKIRQMELSLYK